MRYNTTINNVKANEWKLNIQQAYLFAWLYELPSWADKVIIEGKTYYFASKTKALSELPLLTSKKDTMYRYYKQLELLDLIVIKKIEAKDYVCLTKKGKSWNEVKTETITELGNKSDHSEINPTKLGNKSENNSDLNPTYNNTIYDNYISIKEKNTQNSEQEIKPITKHKFLEIYNDLRKRKGGFKHSNYNRLSTTAEMHLKDLSKQYTEDDFRKAITACMIQVGSKFENLKSNTEHILRPEYFEQYLDAYYNRNKTMYEKPQPKKQVNYNL